tara:strand:+ start:204 stop:650 length:447 start_codon:yes stop_codon:yes gene_type:complete
MTSQLNVDTIVDKAGSGGTNIKVGNDATYVAEGGSATSQNLVQGLAKCWVNFDGSASGAAARDSFNIGSTTDNGSGNYTQTFTSAMDNANYSAHAHANNGTTDVSGAHDYGFSIVDRAAGSFRFDLENPSNSGTDFSLLDALVLGDLA